MPENRINYVKIAFTKGFQRVKKEIEELRSFQSSKKGIAIDIPTRGLRSDARINYSHTNSTIYIVLI